MILGEYLQQELAEAIYQEEKDCVQRMRQEPNAQVKVMMGGKILGLQAAREIVNAWNAPNHGKVTVQTNGETK